MGESGSTDTESLVTRDRSTRSPLFPIAGIGASAGGLAATTELLRHLGQEPGIAVVIVHHLDPAHESSLVQIFSRATKIPVHTVVDGMRIERNHIYVVPPNAGLTLSDGILNLTARPGNGGLHLPIDQFFESLATDRTNYAVAAVLTGSGSDGTEGIRAIKAEGGITFAQDDSAEYGSMPHSAIATGCVDYVLPPHEMARELLRIGAHPPTAPLAVPTAADESDFQRILTTLRKASGVDFVNYKHSTLRRRVQRRVLLHQLPGLHAYAELLERDPGETAALCEEVLIHVTSFFRDTEAFDVLQKMVFPKLLENRHPDAPIRIWIPGCSSGEEVYSIAITLLEVLASAGVAHTPIKIFGTDVSQGAVDKARIGRYPETIEREVSPARLQRFFTKTSAGYQIRKEVREWCVFAKQDATRDPPFSGLDLISCRNLMIYLGSALQERLIPLFHYALKEPGFLILGSAETVRAFPGFAMIDPKNKIYARTSAAPRITFDFTDHRPAEIPDEDVRAVKPVGRVDIHREADRLVLAEFGPPGVVITDDHAIVQFRGQTGAYLEPAPGAASFDLLRMVREELRVPLRQIVEEARSTRSIARKPGLRVVSGKTQLMVDIEAIPFASASTQQRYFVILFKDVTPREPASASEAPPPPPTQTAVEQSLERQLRDELAATRDYLQSVIQQLEASNEELKVANEEIVSSNEELRSTNEELQTAQEELQATNEELLTVNEEMNERSIEQTRLTDDLSNVLSSVEIPIVMLGRDGRIRRFTPAAAKVFRLLKTDIGRPLSDIKAVVQAPDLGQMIADVLEHLSPVERTVQDDAERWYQLTIRPYVTLDNRVDGTVLLAYDIDAVKRGAELLADARKYAESIVDTVRECLLVLDHDLRVRSANRAYYATFRQTPQDVEGRHLYDLSQGAWDLPPLRALLEKMGEGEKVEDVRVEHDFANIGAATPRVFVLNGRRIENTPWILLALEDVTGRERAD